jgi:hypothetical protein
MERIVKCHIDVVHKRTSKKTKRLQNIIGNRQEPKQKKTKVFFFFINNFLRYSNKSLERIFYACLHHSIELFRKY